MTDTSKPATARQYNATAAFHDRAAAAFARFGKTDNAKAARKAAALCRESAKRAQ